MEDKQKNPTCLTVDSFWHQPCVLLRDKSWTYNQVQREPKNRKWNQLPNLSLLHLDVARRMWKNSTMLPWRSRRGRKRPAMLRCAALHCIDKKCWQRNVVCMELAANTPMGVSIQDPKQLHALLQTAVVTHFTCTNSYTVYMIYDTIQTKKKKKKQAHNDKNWAAGDVKD